ncbi:MAG TPA: chemotaxis protein CheW [Spirochaetota bacterium]|nr:chemotaxis protein CheW [Spirochaetota bacterium]
MDEMNMADNARKYLTFLIGSEKYGVDIVNVKEIIEYDQVTRVPIAPPAVRGVLNLRGSVVPIIDLSARFYGYQSTITRLSCIVVVEIEHQEERIPMGLLIDALREVVDIKPANTEQTPGFGAKIRTEFIQGIGKTHGRFVILLNLDRVLDIADIQAEGDVPVRAKATSGAAGGA